MHLRFAFDPKGCPSPEYVHPISGDFDPGHRDALLAIKCSYDFALVVLTRDSDDHWAYSDSVYLWAVYDRLTVALARIVSPVEDDIVVHNDVVVHGTGIYQANFEVFRIADRKLRAVLDTVQNADAEPYGEPQSSAEQSSRFEITPATNGQPGDIMETLTLNLGGKKVVLQREFDWRADFGAFEPSFWSTPQLSEPKAEKPKGN